MVGFGCRKAEINFSFTHFKKILEMYKKAANIEESKKPTSYLSKNILKNKIKINLFQNNIYGEGTIDFSNEADLERIISVLWKTSEKGYKNLWSICLSKIYIYHVSSFSHLSSQLKLRNAFVNK